MDGPASVMILLLCTAVFLSTLEQSVVVEINRLRRDPPAYAAMVAHYARRYDGRQVRLPGETPLATQKDDAAAVGAIRVLRQTKPAPALEPSRGLLHAAQDHVRDQGRRGLVSHTGAARSGPDERASRYSAAPVSVSENITYGPREALRVAIDLLIDDGVKARGHRANLLNPAYRFAGVACGQHAIYRSMCVIDFATEYEERKERAAGYRFVLARKISLSRSGLESSRSSTG